jgi:DNA-directed RNA polymerase specialized sigma24 family protein
MTDPQNRSEKILAQLLLVALKDQPQAEQAAALSRAGFEPAEIAEMIGTTSTSVRSALYALRKAGGKKKRPKK